MPETLRVRHRGAEAQAERQRRHLHHGVCEACRGALPLYWCTLTARALCVSCRAKAVLA